MHQLVERADLALGYNIAMACLVTAFAVDVFEQHSWL